MSDLKTWDMSSQERARFGCMVTLREQRTKRQRSEHLVGRTTVTLAALAEELDELRGQGEDWRVISISTPTTIWRDLQGIRGKSGQEAKRDDPGFSLISDGQQSLEAVYLGKIGREDLLEPLRHSFDASSRQLPLSGHPLGGQHRVRRPGEGLGRKRDEI